MEHAKIMFGCAIRKMSFIRVIALLSLATCIAGMRQPWTDDIRPYHGLQHSSAVSSIEADSPAAWSKLWHYLTQTDRLGTAAHRSPHGQQASSALPPLSKAKAAFLAEHGSSYGYNGWIDAHWQEEVGVRLPDDQHYLDFTGAALYANSQLQAATQMLATEAFGNPHSRNPSSYRSAQLEEDARARVLEWLGADPDEYVLVWTRGATEALKMVGEWFPWSPAADYEPQRGVPPGGVSNHTVGHVSKCGGKLHFKDDEDSKASHFIYTRANHKSVLGVGAYAQDKGALLSCADEPDIQEWLDSPPEGLLDHVDNQAGSHHKSKHKGHKHQGHRHKNNGTAVPTYSLLAYPAKDNYEGVLYPLDWVHKAHAKSTDDHKWLVLLDAAAYVPIHVLNLTETPADFVSMSFYKAFGYPTGLGALVLRKQAADILHKVYFGGGAVDDATAQDLWRLLSPAPARFQDGTIDFIGIAQLQYGFDLVDKLGGMKAIHRHVSALQAWTYKQLTALQHSNKQPLLEIFGKHDTPSQQSCLFQFLVHSPNGSVVPAEDVELAAAAAGVHLRTGCHCNPGQCLKDLGIQPQEERAAALAHNTTHGFITVLRKTHEGGKTKVKPVELPIGSVRASLGALSTFEDVYALIKFLQERYVDRDDVEVLRSEQQQATGLGNVTVQDYWNAKCGA